MKSSLASKLVLAFLLFASIMNFNKADKFYELKSIILYAKHRIGPMEMWYHLTELKRLKQSRPNHPEYAVTIFEESGSEIDDLIEAFNVNKTKCSSDKFSKYRSMELRYIGYSQLTNYLNFLMTKLNELCFNEHQMETSN